MNCTHPARFCRVPHAGRVRSPAAGCARCAVHTKAWRAASHAGRWASWAWRRRGAWCRTAALWRRPRRPGPCGTAWTGGVHHAGRTTPCRRSGRLWGMGRAVRDCEPAAASAVFPVRWPSPHSPTHTTAGMPQRRRSVSPGAGTGSGADGWPSHTGTAQGSPWPVVPQPITLWAWPAVLARLDPKAARAWHAPAQDAAVPSESPTVGDGPVCRRATRYCVSSLGAWRGTSASKAAERSSASQGPSPRVSATA